MSIATASNRYTAQLRAHERHSKNEITAAHERLKRATMPVFSGIIKQLSEAQQNERNMGLWWLYEHNRLLDVQIQVSQAVHTYAAQAAVVVNHGRQHAIEIGGAAALAQLHKRVSVPHVPPPAHKQTLQDRVVTQFATMSDDTNQRIHDALLLAASLGITLTVLQHLLNRSVDRLLWLAVGTDINEEYNAFRDTLGLWYQANSDTVEAWQWTTAEDERVCPFCESMDGSIHALDENMNSHFDCRCEMEPYFY